MNKPFEDKDKLSERELEILNYISDHAPVTVREVAKNWGEPNGPSLLFQPPHVTVPLVI